MTTDIEKDSGSNGKKRKMQIVSMDHARRRRSQQLPVSTESAMSAQTRAQPHVDSHNQLYKLTESVQLLDDKVVNMERMLRKLLRLLRNVTSSRD
jgi:hypothetical protein